MKKNKIPLVLATTLVFSCVGSFVSAEESAPKQKVVTGEQLATEIRHNVQFLSGKSLMKAKALLEAYGDFAPFGAGLMPDGSVKYVWAIKPGESTEGINPVLVLNAVRTALRTQADSGRILGSAVIYRFAPDSEQQANQINIELEYLTGFARVLGTHYQLTEDGYEYTEGAFTAYEPRVFLSGEEG
ncbi:hypothetical protein LPB19_11025 [Marinobacter salinisoli]|uniref:Uncharacterized protein n=1 Tax=Marinobacter salinisoli TaxID=2769486 RepID=A0ABX7MRK6_9GAMM|nr:hypothetical protein [Marinobacter salinisoli]QSP93731.1 hypothetical protein LPB19_11025 [Marinobacter salinisoli]